MPKRSTPTKISFTKAALTALAPPRTGRQYVYDAKTPALALCTTHTGNKAFYLYRRVNGRPQRYRLGGFPELTVEQARKQAAIVNADIATGGDPQAGKRALKAETTFAELFRFFLETHSKVHKRTWIEDERMFKVYLPAWHRRRLSTIKRADVSALHARIGRDHGPYMANRVRSLLCSVFNFAIGNDWDHANPVLGVRKFKEQSRDRFLDGDELKAFFKSLADEPDLTVRDFVLVSLLVGARRGNVQAMRWDDIDLKRGLWRIPETQSKNREPLLVVLPVPAVGILRARHDQSSNGYVFQSYGKKSGHLVDVRTAWRRICKRAGLKDLRLHDLRRTLGSWQAICGASLPIIGRSLGHQDHATTAIYARLDLDPVRRSVEVAAQAMLTAGEATIVPNGEGSNDG